MPTKKSIIRRLERVRDEAAQLVRDAKAWNELHPGSVPFDIGRDLVTAKLAQDCIDAVQSSDGPIPDATFDRLRNHTTEPPSDPMPTTPEDR